MIGKISAALFSDRLARRLIAATILISGVFSILSSGAQVYSRYQSDIDTLRHNFELIETGYLTGIETSIWLFSFSQLEVLLDGLVKQPDITYLNIVTNTGHMFSRGEKPETDNYLRQRYALTFQETQQEEVGIGSLEVYVTTERVNARLWQDIWFILATNTIKTFLVSICLFTVFYMLVGRHLKKIVSDVQGKEDMQADVLVSLQRNLKHKDHLDEIADAINDLMVRVNQSHQQLNDVIKQLVKKNEQLESFAYISSHDLKEPVRTIMGFINLLQIKLEDNTDDDVRRYMQLVVSSGEQIHQLLEALLNYTKIDHMTDMLEVIDMSAVLNTVQKNLQTTLDVKQVKLDVAELPVVRGNKILLVQVLQNLIVNAIKYQPEGQQPVIKVFARKMDGFWEISVQDNGIGIDSRYHRKVFEAFKRLHIQSEYQGSGIGLAICEKIILSLNGIIWVESEPGSGATFRFTLPVSETE